MGHREGLVQGHIDGHIDGRIDGRIEAVVQVLEARGIASALDTREDRELLAGVPGGTLVEAALACTDAVDFRRRVLG